MDSIDHRASLQHVLGFLREELRNRTATVLERIECTMQEAWRNTYDQAERRRILGGAQWLGNHKPRLGRALYEKLALALQTPPAAAPTQDALRVLDDAELTLALLRDQTVSRAMTRCREELLSLEARFHTLSRGGAYANHLALWPGQLADNFRNCLKELEVPEGVQALLLQFYGEHGIEQLQEFYRVIDAWMRERGIGADAARLAEAQRPRIVNLGTTYLRHPERPQLDLEHKLQRLSEALSHTELSDWRPGLLRELFDWQFATPGAGAPAAAISPAQAQTIDHIEALLLDWLRDARISSRVRGELNRLILPLMSARLSRPDEFSAADDPIRVFVRQLALLGYRDHEFALTSFDSLKLVVDRIVAENGADLSSFRSGSQALHTLARHEVKRRLALEAAERTRRHAAEDAQAEARALAEEARQQVLVELTEHAAGLELPAAVQAFVLRLLGPWMMVRLQRYGADSLPWKEARASASLFFDGVRPAVSEADAQRKRAARSRILDQARTRTLRSRMPAPEASMLLAGLQQYFEALDAAPPGTLVHGPGAAGVEFLRAMEAEPATRAA